MESAQRSGKMKAPKMTASNENVSPLQMEMDDQRGRYLQSITMSPRFHPFAENIDASSPLARYFFAGSPISSKVVTSGEAFTSPTFGFSKYGSAKSQQHCGSSSSSSSGSSSRSSFGPRGRLSLSPLSSVANLEMAPHMSPPMYGTPVKVEEEVLVMDDILVRSGGKNGRSSSSSTSSGRGSLSPSSSSSSPWVKNVLKTEVCRAWDEPGGNCRNNSKPQFVHGKEEIHPTRLSMKSRSEAQTGKSPLSAGSGVYGSNSRTVYQHHAAAEYKAARSQPVTPVKLEPRRTLAPTNPNTSSDWSPLDDAIEVVLPNGSDKAPSREEVDSHISRVLNGRTAKRRLLVFVKLCEGRVPVIDKKPPH